MRQTMNDLHQIIESIRHQPVYFNAWDVIEDVDDVLSKYGFLPELDVEDRYLLTTALLSMVERVPEIPLIVEYAGVHQMRM